MGDRVWLPASGRARHDSEGLGGEVLPSPRSTPAPCPSSVAKPDGQVRVKGHSILRIPLHAGLSRVHDVIGSPYARGKDI